MVIEIQQGKLNVTQADAKFEATRTTVEHQIATVEVGQPKQPKSLNPPPA